jgi:hypothetical protein
MLLQRLDQEKFSGKKAAFVDKAGDNPEEEWPAGGRGHQFCILNNILEVIFGASLLNRQILEQSKITKGH